MRRGGAADKLVGAMGAGTGQQVAKNQRSDRSLVGEAAIFRVDPFKASRNLFRARVVATVVEAFEHRARHQFDAAAERIRFHGETTLSECDVVHRRRGCDTTKHTEGCHGYSPISRISGAGLAAHETNGTGRGASLTPIPRVANTIDIAITRPETSGSSDRNRR